MKKTIFMVEDEPLLCELFAEYAGMIDGVDFLGDARDGITALKKCVASNR